MTNGFHHSRSCQRPSRVLRADHGVELAVPAGVDRRFVGFVGGSVKARRLRLEDRRARRRARRAASASSAVQLGPATGSTWRSATSHGPTSRRSPTRRGGELLAGEGAVGRHPEQRHGDAEMGEHHAPDASSGARAATRPNSGSTLATPSAARERQAEAREQADVRRSEPATSSSTDDDQPGDRDAAAHRR